MSSLTKKQKRAGKKKVDKRVQAELVKLKKSNEAKVEAHRLLQYENIVKKNTELEEQKLLAAQNNSSVGAKPQVDPRFVINYVADKNGCGYYRCIWPFELLATYKNIQSMNCFMYQTDPNIINKVKLFRFQRQATDTQLSAWNYFKNLRDGGNFNFKMQYEIDDLLMEISPHNKIAYNFFDENKKNNHLAMLRTADSVTFSTDALKDIYVKDYGIDPSKIHVVRNFLPQFLYSLPYRNKPREMQIGHPEKKPRIFWGGSASHLGKNGDLHFLMDLIEKTVDEYKWVFQGVVPPEFNDLVRAGKIEFIPWTPVYGLANVQFYKARADICLAPLVPNKFNSAKSDLKYLESCALGAPCITTSFDGSGFKSPYDIANAEICLEPDAEIWKAMIDYLVENPDYYADVVKKQYDFLNGRWMENNLDMWEKAIS